MRKFCNCSSALPICQTGENGQDMETTVKIIYEDIMKLLTISKAQVRLELCLDYVFGVLQTMTDERKSRAPSMPPLPDEQWNLPFRLNDRGRRGAYCTATANSAVLRFGYRTRRGRGCGCGCGLSWQSAAACQGLRVALRSSRLAGYLAIYLAT